MRISAISVHVDSVCGETETSNREFPRYFTTIEKSINSLKDTNSTSRKERKA